jgi:DNA-directed RNA polymerase subunit M/transcription elongation factor TFIIS
VLRAEVARRGLQAQPSDVPTQESDFTEDDFVGVWKASSLSEAEAIKQILDYAGVSSCLVPDDTGNTDPAQKDTDLGIEVKVLRCQVQRANDAILPYLSDLYAAYPSSAPKPEQDNAYSASCPSCGSQDVVFLGLTEDRAEGTAGDRKFNWTCDACGHRWQDDGNEESH